MQYGPIAHIDLKIPPRPPGFAFVEVRVWFKILVHLFCKVLYGLKSFFFSSLKKLVMLRMLLGDVMVMILMDTDCGLVTHSREDMFTTMLLVLGFNI